MFLLLFFCFISIVVQCAPSCNLNGQRGNLTSKLFPRPFPLFTNLHNLSESLPTHLVVVVHGTLRNADEYFCTIVEGASMVGQRPLIVAPHFLDKHDGLTDYMFWDENHDWKQGNQSTIAQWPRVSSFAVMDELIAQMVRRFPSLRTRVLVGHSAGGQFVHRYALTSQSPHLSTLRLIPTNPSSYTYFSRWRPEKPHTPCNLTFNEFPYGLEGLNPYATLLGPTGIRARYSSVNVTYFLGLNDTCNHVIDHGSCDDHDLDVSCAGMAEGPYRLARGLNYYFRELQQTYGKQIQHIAFAPGIGHDHAGMFLSPVGLKLIFGI